MDYEKKYKEALGWMQSLYNGLHGKTKEEAEKYFPELKESEDERIRKELIFYLGDMPEDTELRNGITNRDVLAWLEKQKSVGEIVERCKNSWYNEGKIAGMAEGLTDDEKYQQGWHDALEKQGKQKYADKTEPKFKVGDWIITKDKNVHKDYSVCKIVEIENNRYHLENGDYLDIDTLEQYDYRLWTIQDAKDGDVLAFKNNIGDIIICKSPTNYNTRSYCRLVNEYLIKREESGWDSTLLVPTTKEQRELLFKKMKEAGYQWNPDKKELKKVDKKIAWSEDDEEFYNDIIKYFSDLDYSLSHDEDDVINWLKSLKERLS